MPALLVIVLIAFVTGALVWLFERSRGQRKLIEFEKSNRTLFEQWTEARDRLAEAQAELKQSGRQMGEKDQRIARLEERVAAAQSALEQMRSSLPDTFKSLAAEVLEERSRVFAEQNRSSLAAVLAPLRERLTDFQARVEDVHAQQVRGEATLQEQVRAMLEANTQISQEANRLAAALKGDNKTQGTWGELILERVLESGGLRKGWEYEAQQSHTTENGRRVQPDVVVRLPGDRQVVIDSKVSLLAYEAHCNANDDASRAAAVAEHLKSIQTHIAGLSQKNYQQLYSLNSLDFVVMFLPVEPALILALSRDDKLWDKAAQKNVLLAGPSLLLYVLRTVSSLWRQEEQRRNVEEIARRGAELYDKLTAFVADLERVGGSLESAQRSYDEALKKLSSGRGNVIRQAEMLRQLGVQPSKQLPQGLVELSRQEDLALDGPSLPGENGAASSEPIAR